MEFLVCINTQNIPGGMGERRLLDVKRPASTSAFSPFMSIIQGWAVLSCFALVAVSPASLKISCLCNEQQGVFRFVRYQNGLSKPISFDSQNNSGDLKQYSLEVKQICLEIKQSWRTLNNIVQGPNNIV
jgi:hypothetical protein